MREILTESDLTNLSFAYANALDIDSLPEGDILLVKDVLSYWPFMHISNWLFEVIRKSKWRFIAITNNAMQLSSEMPWGRYHGINPKLCKFLRRLDYKTISLSKN